MTDYTWINQPFQDGGNVYLPSPVIYDAATGNSAKANYKKFLWRLDAATIGTFSFEDELNISNPDVTGLNNKIQNLTIPADWEIFVTVNLKVHYRKKKTV